VFDCAGITEAAAPQNHEKVIEEKMKPLTGTEAEISNAASTILEKVLDAHESNDYAQLSGLLGGPAEQGLTEKIFHEAVDNQLRALDQEQK
jgi:hypothetical protein